MRITHPGNSSARYELGIFRNDETEASALGYVVYVYVDRASNAPVAIPQLVLTSCAGLSTDPCINARPVDPPRHEGASLCRGG